MEWIVVAVIGALIGMVVGFALPHGSGRSMPQVLPLVLGAFGGIIGGALFTMARAPIFGEASFYIYGALLSLAVIIGGTLAFNLTSPEHSVENKNGVKPESETEKLEKRPLSAAERDAEIRRTEASKNPAQNVF